VTPEIIVALIGVCGSALGSLIGIIANSKLTAYRLQQLEEKVDKHNNLVGRTYEIETDIEVIKNDIKVANHRIDDLERKGA
jgi:hypothetical protein